MRKRKPTPSPPGLPAADRLPAVAAAACGGGSRVPVSACGGDGRAPLRKSWTGRCCRRKHRSGRRIRSLYTLKTNSQMDVALSCAVVKGNRTLTENCTAAGASGRAGVYRRTGTGKLSRWRGRLCGGFSEASCTRPCPRWTYRSRRIPPRGARFFATGQGAISWEAGFRGYARVWYTVAAGTTEATASTDVQDWRTTFSISLYASKSAYESERT